jgi:hypothetical protein
VKFLVYFFIQGRTNGCVKDHDWFTAILLQPLDAAINATIDVTIDARRDLFAKLQKTLTQQ